MQVEKEKKNKGLIIIIIFLIIALLGTTGYIIYDKVVKKEPQQEEKKQTKKEEEEESPQRKLTEEEKTTLLSQIETYTNTLAGEYTFDEELPLENQQALLFALIQLESTGQDYMESDLEKVLQQYFGENHPYQHENIECFLGDGTLYIYDSAKREYRFQDYHAHGGQGIYPNEVYYIDGNTDEQTYTINVNILYGDYCNSTCGPTTSYYTTANDSRNGINPILGPYENLHTITQEEYNSIQETLPITTFTFEKDDIENYGLKRVTIK